VGKRRQNSTPNLHLCATTFSFARRRTSTLHLQGSFTAAPLELQPNAKTELPHDRNTQPRHPVGWLAAAGTAAHLPTGQSLGTIDAKVLLYWITDKLPSADFPVHSALS